MFDFSIQIIAQMPIMATGDKLSNLGFRKIWNFKTTEDTKYERLIESGFSTNPTFVGLDLDYRNFIL